MPDQTTSFESYMDTVAYVTSRCGQYVPFIGWGIGRFDGFASWQEQLDMVNALKACHHGFAFSWNGGGHSDAVAALGVIMPGYGTAYVKDKSYPAFTNSSLDSNPGNGDPNNGDTSGCINCGFSWTGLAETGITWTAQISNSLNPSAMTADVTPRNTQAFLPQAGQVVSWTASTGQSGTQAADQYGLVTVSGLTINTGAATTLSFSIPPAGSSLTGKTGMAGNAVAH